MKKKNCYFSPPISSGGQRLHSQWLERLGNFVSTGNRLLLMLVMLFMVMPSVMSQTSSGYITDLIVIGNDSGSGISGIKDTYKSKGYTFVDKDLNKNAKGWYVYIGYKTSDSPMAASPKDGYVTDIVASSQNKASFTFNGRKYIKIPTNDGYNGDVNRGAGGAAIYLYYTKERTNLSGHYGTKRSVCKLSGADNASSSASGAADDYGPICWSDTYSGACDMNKGISGSDYIFIRMHFVEQSLTIEYHPTIVNNLIYNGQAQKLMTAPKSTNRGTMMYQVDGGNWSTNLPVATTDGSHTVKYYLDGESYAKNSSTTTKTVSIAQPTACPTNLQGQFKQADRQVVLTWNTGNIPSGFTKYKWVVYRGDTKLKAIDSNATRIYTDKDFTNETDVTYHVYYVANEWGEDTKKDEAKVSVKVNTTRKVPVNNLKADVQTYSDRVILTWSSVGYKLNWGNKFNIYVDKETEPIITITPKDNQTSFRWEHRYTDKHSDRQNKTDSQTNVLYTEEQNLGACTPHSYRIEGVIDGKKLNEASVEKVAIGSGAQFYSLEATKGSYAGLVKLSWHIDNQGSEKSKKYVIERKVAESNEAWNPLARLQSADDYLLYTDDTAQPGVYYEYRVTVVDKCDNGSEVNSSKTVYGFSQATGTVSGRVTYGSSGSSVEGVEVTVLKAGGSDGENAQYRALHFNDSISKAIWEYPTESYAQDNFSSGDFSIQMWIKPEAFTRTYVARLQGENKGLGVTVNGELMFCNGSDNIQYFGLKLEKEKYSHVTLTRTGGTLTAYVISYDEDGLPVVKKSTKTFSGSLTLTNSTAFELGYLQGYIDDFRLWKKCLTEDEVKENFDHLLVGNEKNLETYWTFDEGLNTQFFDYSREGTVYNQHHGVIDGNVVPDTETPTYLALKAKTDMDGNFTIQGVPFTGEGTNYNVVPLKNSHEFSPQKQSRFVSASSLVHNSVDFTDVSSFEVRGTILYAGTNIPVDSVSIYVDGRAVSRNNEPVQTNAEGEFVVDVPIGKHYLTAVRDGHTFVDGGRIPEDPAGTNQTYEEFVSPRSGLVFIDNTLVPVAGRIVGGAIEGNKPLGFGLSNNNIGKAVITLEIPDKRYMINAYEDFQDESHLVSLGYVPVKTKTELTHPEGMENPGDAYLTGGEYESDAKNIVITTSAETGEFGVMLPPLDYKVVSVKMDNADADKVYKFESENLPRIDASDATVELKDSVVGDDGKYRYFSYVALFKQTVHSDPVLNVTQEKAPAGVFGKSQVSYVDPLTKEEKTYDAYTKTGNSVTYTYGFPIFGELGTYTFNLEGYETYTNYEKPETDTGRESKVPLKDVIVTISNALSSSQVVQNADDPTNAGKVLDLKSNQLQLDSLGKAKYKWQAGLPNIQSPYTRSLNMTYSNGSGEYSWKGLEGIIFGDLPSGTNFTTEGPSEVEMILHDPYGDSSFSTWETGKITVESKDTLGTHVQDNDAMLNIHAGPDFTTNTGFGVSVQSESDVIADISTGFDRVMQNDTIDSHITTLEATRAISTSSDPDFVGADGDVYIGKSTNLLFGKARSVGLMKNKQGNLEVGVDNVITMSKKFSTNFVYTQYHIINILIPHLEEVRNELIVPNVNVNTAKNNTDENMYVSALSSDDPNFGKPGTYKVLAKQEGPDMVSFYNDQIDCWEKIIEQEEEYKLKLFKEGKDKKNVSFGGGTEITESTTSEKTHSRTISYTHNWTYIFSADLGFTWNGLGLDAETTTNTTWENTESETTEETTTTTFSYTLADSGSDDSFSMDIYPASGNRGPVFRTMGGQSSCPYEGQEVTKYYQVGTELSTATVQMEDPEISCRNNMLTGVPTGGKAQFELQLKNNSATNTDAYFNLVPVDGTNEAGALLSLPTGPIGNGRSILVPANETVKMILTLQQGNLDVTKYDGIQLALTSQCQNDPTSIHGAIASYVTLSAEFVPASTPVQMAINKNVVNNTTVKDDLKIQVTGFDRHFTGLKSVNLQYMAPGEQSWSLLESYIPDSLVRENAAQKLLPENGVINLAVDMNDSKWIDGVYQFRAQSSAIFGGKPVTSESEIITVVKDLSRPQLFGAANPSDGVLNSGDEISVTFNEDIQKEMLTKNNFVVSGILNGSEIQHDVALSAQNTERAAYTEASYNLKNKSFSADMWVRVTDGGDIFTHGNKDNKFKVSVNADGQLVISIGENHYPSGQILEKNTWTFLAFSYDNEGTEGRLSVRAVTANSTMDIFRNKVVAGYNGTGAITLGQNFSGAIHELTLWDKAREMSEAQAEMYKTKVPSTPNLIGYWKLDEGNGLVATDYARNRHMTLVNNSWYLNNDNKAVSINATSGLKIDISACNPTPSDSYAMEMWFKGKKADNAQPSTLFYASNHSVSMGFDANGILTMTVDNAATEMGNANYLDNAWHHLALNVLRNGNATVYVDGAAVKTMSASAVPALSGANLYVGSRAGTQAFTGMVDEIRIWNASMTGDLINSQRTQRLTGKESGLVAYYSFEQMSRATSGIISSVGSAKDLCTGTKVATMQSGDIAYMNDAPAMKVKPEATNVDFNYVANERGIVLTLDEKAARLEGTTLNFTVKGVKDLNGNESSAVSWTAFVKQNNLTWKGDTDVTLEKEVGEAATFEATFTNDGGDSENWTLTGLPTWLTASATSGTLKATLSKTITFTVAESLSTGKYEQTIYLTGNKNISEPLTLNLKVKSKAPDWAVNPKQFDNSMNVIGRVELDNLPMDDEDDIIAAFIGEECRGVAHPTYKERYDGSFITMDIYGNSDKTNGDAGKEITFRAFDASTGALYPVVTPNKTIKFAPLTLQGSYKQPVVFTVEDLVEQSTELQKGWNWLSIYVSPKNKTVPAIFEKIADDVISVKSQGSGWLMNENGSWDGDLNGNLSNTEMYAVQMKNDRTLRIVGQRVDPATTAVTVADGWNWIGYYGLKVSSVSDALAGFGPEDGDILKGQCGVTYFDEYEWAGSLPMLEPGLGYMLNVTLGKDETKQFSYPSSTVARYAKAYLFEDMDEVAATEEESAFKPVSFRKYPYNAMMSIKLLNGGVIMPNTEVGVFADNECRAKAQTNAKGVAYLTIPGEDESELTFKIAIGDEIVDAPTVVNFEADGVYGTPKDPVIIELDEATSISEELRVKSEESVYDLSGRKINVDSKLSTVNSKLKSGIYIINGQKKAIK